MKTTSEAIARSALGVNFTRIVRWVRATARELPKEPSGPDCLCTAFLGTPGSLLAPTGGAIPSRLQNQIHRPAPTSSLKPVTHAPDRLRQSPRSRQQEADL